MTKHKHNTLYSLNKTTGPWAGPEGRGQDRQSGPPPPLEKITSWYPSRSILTPIASRGEVITALCEIRWWLEKVVSPPPPPPPQTHTNFWIRAGFAIYFVQMVLVWASTKILQIKKVLKRTWPPGGGVSCVGKSLKSGSQKLLGRFEYNLARIVLAWPSPKIVQMSPRSQGDMVSFSYTI